MCPIHRSARKGCSANFGLTAFAEVRRLGFYSHGAFSPPLEAFDDDELCDGGLAAYLFKWSVFRRVVPLVEALHALEFEDDQTLRIPVTLHYLYCATASKVLDTIGGNGGWSLLPIFGIAIRIADPDVNNSVDCNRLCSFTPLPSFVANFTIGARSPCFCSCSLPYSPNVLERLYENYRARANRLTIKRIIAA